MEQIDILNVEWFSGGRDRPIIEPILAGLTLLRPDITIKRVDINLGFLALLLYKPKILLTANSIGADINFNLVKFAKKLGVYVITLNSEGDYIETESSVKAFFWGWNYEEKLYDDLQMVWSERVEKLIHQYVTNADTIRENIKVSGGIGFDRYNILEFMSKKAFLIKENKTSYQNIITLAGFGFDYIVGDYYTRNAASIDERFGKEFVPLHIKAQALLSDIYYELIKRFPNILFIVKQHPFLEQPELTEFSKILQNIDNFANVLIISNQYPIEDIINISDLWIAYESTTCMEAWLLNKTTLLINPAGKDFLRSRIAQGSPIYKNFDEAVEKIEEFMLTNTLKDFENLKEKRINIYTNVIQSNDGLNHLRAIKYIMPFIDKEYRFKMNVDAHDFFYVVKRSLARLISLAGNYTLLRKIDYFNKRKFFAIRYNYKEEEKFTHIYRDKLKIKYQKMGITINNYLDYV